MEEELEEDLPRLKVGLIVNPIAGMGGVVGLKGTDGDVYKNAIQLGAKPVTPNRVEQFFTFIEHKDKLFFYVAPGKMGANLLNIHDFKFKEIGDIQNETNAEDTKRIAKQMLDENVEIIVFCGGDGTARDIFDSLGDKVPVLAIPSGVKMFSSVFAVNPRSAAEVLDKFIMGQRTVTKKEVLDIDEDSYRKGKLDSKLYGFLKVPDIPHLIQVAKDGSRFGKTVEFNKQEIAHSIIKKMEKDTLYLLGPGTTVKMISDLLEVQKSLLGIDAIYNETFIDKDLNEKDILGIMEKYPKVKIVLSPIGGQGFIIKPNTPFTPKVLNKVGLPNIILVATGDKLSNIESLMVDSGDLELDKEFEGFMKVTTGYLVERIVTIRC